MSHAHGWTPERRARQAALIRTWAPWEHSTGPRTEAGKAKVAQNGYRGGARNANRAMLKQLREMIAALMDSRDTMPLR